jgi:uncharacterized protein YacL (UPF0231 family)
MKDTIEYTRPNAAPVPIGKNTGGAAIANWLASDIQYSLKTLDEWLECFSEIANATRPGGYQGTGNAFSVYAHGQHALLECEFSENLKAYLTTDQIMNVLLQYKTFLQNEFRHPSFRPSPFEVEYLAEGDAAQQLYLENGGIL